MFGSSGNKKVKFARAVLVRANPKLMLEAGDPVSKTGLAENVQIPRSQIVRIRVESVASPAFNCVGGASFWAISDAFMIVGW